MADPPPPGDTRRGLVLTLTAQSALLLLGLLFGVGSRSVLSLLLLWVTALAAAAALLFLWQGRHEHRPGRTAGLKAAWALAALAGLLLLLVVTALGTTVRETGRVEDLRAPLYLLVPLAAAEATALALALWPLADRAGRALLGVLAVGGAVAVPLLTLEALRLVESLRLRFGPQLDPGGRGPETALDVFFEQVQGPWAAYVVLSRLLILAAVWRVLGQLTAREAEALTST